MPKEGYTSVTIPQTVHDKLFEIYQSQKKSLHARGISSFSGFVVYHLRMIFDLEEEK